MFVNYKSVFHVDKSNANKFTDYEAHVVTELLNNFTSGCGPENGDFPTNGIISSKFLNSDILKHALSNFNSGRSVNNSQYHFGLKELAKDAARNFSGFGITGFVGGITITMVPTIDHFLIITVYRKRLPNCICDILDFKSSL